MPKNELFTLRSVNLTDLGGPMGTETTWDNYIKYFNSIEAARAYAEKEFGEKIRWAKDGSGLTSGDLRHVAYDIEKIKIEGE